MGTGDCKAKEEEKEARGGISASVRSVSPGGENVLGSRLQYLSGNSSSRHLFVNDRI